jgi:hypothetical protein
MIIVLRHYALGVTFSTKTDQQSILNSKYLAPNPCFCIKKQKLNWKKIF